VFHTEGPAVLTLL